MKFAIVESGGKQYKATEGSLIDVDRLPVEPGSSLKLEQVLLLVDGDNVSVGTPFLKDLTVWTSVVEHFKGKKLTIFNYRPKKRIRVKTGHRQNYTRLLVEQLGGEKLEKRKTVSLQEKEAVVKPEQELPEKVSPVRSAAEKPTVKKTTALAKKPVSRSTTQKTKAAVKKTVKPTSKSVARKTEPKKME